MTCKLRVVTWNANGLTGRRQELETFLHMELIDVALISETRITSKTLMALRNFSVYTTNHPSGNSHGGTAVIIKSNIKHYPIQNYCTEKIQATTIKILDNRSEIALSAVYCPPRHTITANDFETYFLTLGPRFICGGDWNSKHLYWGARLINPRGRQLLKVIENTKLECVATREPTYWPNDRNKTPDLLDFFVTKNVDSNFIHIESRIDLTSDHTPVILNLNSIITLVEPPNRVYNHRTNWTLYQNIIDAETDLRTKIDTTIKLESVIEQFNITIHKAANNATTKPKGQPIKHNTYPINIKVKIQERRRLRKIWHSRGYPSDKTQFNRCSAEVSTLIKTLVNSNLQSYLLSLSPTADTNYSLFKATKQLKRPKTHIPPIKNCLGGWAKSDAEKATTFAEYLSTVFQPFPEFCDEHTAEITNFLETAKQMCPPLKSTGPNEVRTIIKSIPEGKSPGYDLIDATLLKQLPHKGIMSLVKIFNACLRLEYFPCQWKIAQVVMIPKPGKPLQETTSYRPISLLPVISKIFERVLLNRMKQHLKVVIPNHQFGFRQKHGTIEQVHRIVDIIGKCFEDRMYCSAVFLDISQAFDKVWHEGLIYKLKKQLPHSFFNILKSYLSNRSFQVKFNNDCSTLRDIKSGVPQGSILGPTLYLLYTADLPTTDDTTTATFADDTALLSSHINPETASLSLQRHLDKVEKWLKQWRIKVNQNKSTHVTFSLRKETCPPVKLNEVEIPQENHAKYLGMHLDRRLTWQKHIWTKRKQLDAKLRSLYWLIGRQSQLNIISKMTVYKAIIKPIWTYGIQLWGAASVSNIEILERFQTKAMRSIFNIPKCISNKFVYLDLNIKTVKQEISHYSGKHQSKLTNHSNELACSLNKEGSLRHIRLKRKDITTLSTRFFTH